MSSSSQSLFGRQFCSTDSGFTSRVYSQAARMSGNKAVLACLVEQISASSTFTLGLEGSYDNVTWKTISSTTKNAFGYATLAATGVDYPFVRASADLAGTTVSVLFSMWLAVTSQ